MQRSVALNGQIDSMAAVCMPQNNKAMAEAFLNCPSSGRTDLSLLIN